MTEKLTTAEPGKPRRRWFQFRLQTLLASIVIASLPCAYVADQARFVAARKAWLANHAAPANGPNRATNPPATVPWIRQLLGDKAQQGVFIGGQSEFNPAKALFPEARYFWFANPDVQNSLYPSPMPVDRKKPPVPFDPRTMPPPSSNY